MYLHLYYLENITYTSIPRTNRGHLGARQEYIHLYIMPELRRYKACLPATFPPVFASSVPPSFFASPPPPRSTPAPIPPGAVMIHAHLRFLIVQTYGRKVMECCLCCSCQPRKESQGYFNLQVERIYLEGRSWF